MGLRLIGIDRPGYGLSTLEPGRTIASWAPSAIAVADHLGLLRFMTMGISTGGSYSLCVAALYPERVIAVVTGCAMTDMSHPAAMASMPGVGVVGLAASRDEAITLAESQFGVDGRGPPSGELPEWAWGREMPAADMAVLQEDMVNPAAQEAKRQQSFANGVQGFVTGQPVLSSCCPYHELISTTFLP
jgi:pimeloyl-ACP methyl ester carboxylesterase